MGNVAHKGDRVVIGTIIPKKEGLTWDQCHRLVQPAKTREVGVVLELLRGGVPLGNSGTVGNILKKVGYVVVARDEGVRGDDKLIGREGLIDETDSVHGEHGPLGHGTSGAGERDCTCK